jgi:Uma2 family endonuclease
MDNLLIQTPIITEDDLLRLGAKGERFEVIKGELVPMSPVGFEHSTIAFNVAKILDAFVRKNKLGFVRPDSLIYVLRTNEKGVQETRVPDVSFIRNGRFPKGFDFSRPFPGAPDLAVEVVSPSETAEDVMDKILDYLSEGTEQVWVLYPRKKTLHVYNRATPEQVRIYHEHETLRAENLFPNLELVIADCFVRDFED